jgi:hypothetical protein
MMLFNSFSHVDEVLKDSLYKSIQAFRNCPADLPQYSDYFFNNLTQSIANISNIETEWRGDIDEKASVNGPHYQNLGKNVLSPKNRIEICEGALNHLSLKQKINNLNIPIVVVHSKNNCLIHIKHADMIMESGKKEKLEKRYEGEVASIQEIMLGYSKRKMILIDGGHDVFKENKQELSILLNHFCGSKVQKKQSQQSSFIKSLTMKTSEIS